MPDLNPIQLEIIRNALIAAAEEMSITVWRTSRSSVVREILDYSTCVFDQNGDSVAQAARMPVHLNSMASCLRDLLDQHIPLSDWQEDDVIITNDPYCGGQHLPDIQTFAPVFLQGRRIAIVGVLVHHLDVGGGAPGSYYAEATEIYQEGLRIPPLKLIAAGKRNDAIIKILLQNSREPVNVGGDFNSQLAALHVGVKTMLSVGKRYGRDRLAQACDLIQAQSEQSMRTAIEALPDGVYEAEDFVDDDGISDTPIRIGVKLNVSAERLEIDLSGSSHQATGPVNCTLNMSSSAVICAVMMSIGQAIPANAGCYRPITIIAPPGTAVNALPPAPVANRMAVGHRVVNAVIAAFAQVLPDKIAAAYYGVSYAYALNCINEDGSRQVYFDLECGGWGAHPDSDGANGFSCGFHNIANSPVEMIENDYPVTFMRYELKPDSGGAGKMRGGLGLVREWRVDAAQGLFAANLDRFKFPPPGLQGGHPGSKGCLWLKRQGHDNYEALDSKVAGLNLNRGDVIRLETSGGGGYGNPITRSSEAVADDLANGYVNRRSLTL